ncbi:MAG: hypothetical protein K1X57_08430 [Gemmataceae bacterium]|nr:hypothetical protein [Gemmataceae bacterium]
MSGQLLSTPRRRFSATTFMSTFQWQKSCPAEVQRLGIALDFYQRELGFAFVRKIISEAAPTIPRMTLGMRPLGSPDGRNAGPFLARNAAGQAIRLCTLVQAIRFTDPVEVVRLSEGTEMKQLRDLSREEPSIQKLGQWFAEDDADGEHLALPALQTQVWKVVVTRDTLALKSTAADAFTWKDGTGDSTRDRYFRGGETQYFVARPRDCFSLAEPEPSQ